MIDKIAYELVKSISTNVGFIDKWAGLVKPMRKMVQKTEKVFPVAISTPSNCDQSDYTALVPDDTKRSVAYIEMIQSPTVDVIRHGSRQLSAQLRLIVWYNLDRITAGKYVSEDMLVDQIFRSLPRRLNNSLFNGASQVHVMSTGVTYGAEVVSQYTYNEVKSQFVTHPYGIFAIDLDVWYITTYCQSPFDIEAGCTTGKGNHNNYLTVPSLSDLDAEIVGDNIVFSVVVDTGHSNTVLTLFWGETELTMTNEVNMGEFTENGTFTFTLPTDYFGINDIFWLIKATNLNGSVNSDIQGSNVNQIPVIPDGTQTSVLNVTDTAFDVISSVSTSNSTVVELEYGTASGVYTDTITAEESPISATGDVNFSLTGLTPYTDYYLRVKATNSAGTAYSNEFVQRTTEPAIISDGNTVAWYDYTEASTITKDGSNFISQWRSRIGSNHLNQAVGTNQPLLADDGVLFDGIDNFLKTDAFTFNQPEFSYIVLKLVNWVEDMFLIDGSGASSMGIRAYSTSPNLRIFTTSGGFNITAVNGEFYILRVLFNGESSKAIINNNAALTGNVGSVNANGITLGARGNATSYANVEFKELIARKVADNSTDESAIYNYLKKKYGL